MICERERARPTDEKEGLETAIETWALRGAAGDLREIGSLTGISPLELGRKFGLNPSILDLEPIMPLEKAELAKPLVPIIREGNGLADPNNKEGKKISLASGVIERAANALAAEQNRATFSHPLSLARRILSWPGLGSREFRRRFSEIGESLEEYELFVAGLAPGIEMVIEKIGLTAKFDPHKVAGVYLPIENPSLFAHAIYISINPYLVDCLYDQRLIFGFSPFEIYDYLGKPFESAQRGAKIKPPQIKGRGAERKQIELINSLAPSGFPKAKSREDLEKERIWFLEYEGNIPISYILFDDKENHALVALIPKGRCQRINFVHEAGHIFNFWQLLQNGWKPEEIFFLSFTHLETSAYIAQAEFPGIEEDERMVNYLFYPVQRVLSSYLMFRFWEAVRIGSNKEELIGEMRKAMASYTTLGSDLDPRLWAVFLTRTGFQPFYHHNYSISYVRAMEYLLRLKGPLTPEKRTEIYGFEFPKKPVERIEYGV